MITCRKKQFSLIALVILLALTACSNSNSTGSSTDSPAAKRTDLEILGSSGSTYQIAVGIADIISNNSSDYRVSATGTANTAANVMAMKDKDPDRAVYMISTAAYVSAQEGSAAFAEFGPNDNQRMIAAFVYGNNGLVTLNPNIKTIADLDGKTIAWDAQAIHAEHMLKVAEILGIEVNIKYLGFTDKYDALNDGIVDACYANFTGAPNTIMEPVSVMQELVLTKDLYPISFPAELQSQAAEGLSGTWPYMATVAEAGTIPDKDSFELYGAATIALACSADADEEMIYHMTKIVAENCDKLKNFDPGAAGLTPDKLVSLMGDIEEAEIHPGALKYYKEAGLWPPQ